MNYEDYLKLASKRRTIRKFKPEAVSKDDIKKIIKAGSLAPSGFNSQPWEFAVINDLSLRREIVKYMQAALEGVNSDTIEPDMTMTFATAPTFIIVYGDSKVRDFGLPYIKADDASWMFTLNTTLAFATAQMNLAVTSLNMGAMWVSAVRREGIATMLQKLLGIPEDMILFGLMAVGYPDIEPKAKIERALDEMIHWDRQDKGDYRTLDEVKTYFKKQ